MKPVVSTRYALQFYSYDNVNLVVVIKTSKSLRSICTHSPFYKEDPTVTSKKKKKKLQEEIPRSLSQLLTDLTDKAGHISAGWPGYYPRPVNHEVSLPHHHHVPTLQAGE